MKLKDLKNKLDQLTSDELELELDSQDLALLPCEIYLTYDTLDGEVFGAFVSEQRCTEEVEEVGCGMQTIRLVGNNI